jgi:hypothetical protein
LPSPRKKRIGEDRLAQPECFPLFASHPGKQIFLPRANFSKCGALKENENGTSNANHLQMLPGAAQCPICGGTGTQPQKVLRVPYDYVFPQTVIALANGQGNMVLQIMFDSDFEWIFTVGSSTGAFTITVNDSSTGRNLSNSPVLSSLYMGTAQLPFPFVEPYLLARSTTITAAVQDASGAPNNTINLVFKGFKLFPQDQPQQGAAGQVFPASPPAAGS